MLPEYLPEFKTEEAKAKFTEIYEENAAVIRQIPKAILQDEALEEEAIRFALKRIANNIEKILDEDSRWMRGFVVVMMENSAYSLLWRRKRGEKHAGTVYP